MFSITPIGFVRNEIRTHKRSGWGSVESDLVLNEDFTDALDGIEDYSHVMVLFWFDKAEAPDAMKHHARHREDLPIVGIFAGNGPSRPNPTGVSVVPILGRDGNILKVKRLEAFDGTPIVDIKPYTPAFYLKPNAKVPDWNTLIYEREDYF